MDRNFNYNKHWYRSIYMYSEHKHREFHELISSNTTVIDGKSHNTQVDGAKVTFEPLQCINMSYIRYPTTTAQYNSGFDRGSAQFF